MLRLETFETAANYITDHQSSIFRSMEFLNRVIKSTRKSFPGHHPFMQDVTLRFDETTLAAILPTPKIIQ